MRRKVILIASILVSLMLVGVVLAATLNREAALRWDDPAWEQTYGVAEFDTPITPTLFSLTGTVRLINSAGAVVDSQTIEISGCEAGTTPGSGRCGAAYSWEWESDDYAKGLGTLTEQVRIAWIAPDYDPNIEVVIPWAPANCDLSGAGCTILFDQSTWTASLPITCENTLRACGSYADEDGWWTISTFQGTKTWTWCAPLLIVGDTQ